MTEYGKSFDSRWMDMKDEYAQIIINRINKLCSQRGISLYQLSAMSGVSYSTLAHIINSRTSNPGLKTIHKLAHAFSMTLPEFLDFEELTAYSFDDGADDTTKP